MNQHMNQELMWKGQNLITSPANGSSFEDKNYHGPEKMVCDRSIIKEYKNYNDIEPGSLIDGNYVQNNNDTSMSKIRFNSDQPITDEFVWFYLDPRSNLQGPFLDSQMFQWWSQGIYFQNSLLMKRKCDADFSTLQDYSKRFNGVPFDRKDIRVPPLTESLTMSSSNHGFLEPKLYSNGLMAPIHRNNQSVPPMNDHNYILHLMSTAPNQSQEELTKILQKMNIQQRLPPQMNYDQPQNTSVQNGSDPFLNSAGSSSLSNFVNLRLNNPVPQSQAYHPDVSKTGHIANYMKNERFPSSSWAQMQQPKLTDSVWTSTTDDTIHSPNVQVWSRSTNETYSSGPSLLNTIFHDTPHKHNTVVSNSHNKSNQMQETWDNLDPAIIKMVPLSEQSNHSIDNKQHTQQDNISTNQMEQHRAHHTSQHNPVRSHIDNVKHPWADLVRKSNNSVGDQKSKTGFNTENDPTNHSTSPNQHKTSLTSSSSDEYDQLTRESSDKDLETLIKWSKTYLENKPGIVGVDIGTLIELLIYVESPYEVEATMNENVPEFDSIGEFVKIFVEKRRPLRQKLFSDNPKKKSDQSVSKIELDEDTKWQVKSKSHGTSKKKRKNNTKN